MPSRIDTSLLRRLIKEAGFKSYAAFGAHVGLSGSTMDRVLNENNEHNYNSDTIERIAKGLNLSPFDLYKKEAIDAAVAAAAAEAVAEAVTEAVVEAVTVVAVDVAPEVPAQQIASAIPQLNVTPPPALDPAVYLDYIRDSRKQEIDLLTQSCEQRIAECESHNRQIRRNLYITIGAMAFIILYLLYELFSLDRGIAAYLMG